MREIIKREDRKILWVFGARRYPIIHGKETREAKLRILNVILGDDIPEAHDIMLVALADACGLFRHMLSEQEWAKALPRIGQVARMDLLGRALGQAIANAEASVALA
jgi:hypothetical protein